MPMPLWPFFFLLACQLVGEVVVRALGLPLPGPVLGMALLLGGLVVKGSVPRALEATAGLLMRHLSLLFIPAGVGVVAQLGRLETAWWPLALAIVLGTAVAVLVTGLAAQHLLADRHAG